MTLTPSSLRLDLKCGKGAISEGEKCSKGPATKAASARSVSSKNRSKEAQKRLHTAAAVVGAVALGTIAVAGYPTLRAAMRGGSDAAEQRRAWRNYQNRRAYVESRGQTYSNAGDFVRAVEQQQREVMRENDAFMRGYRAAPPQSQTQSSNSAKYAPVAGSVEARIHAAWTAKPPSTTRKRRTNPNPDVSAAWARYDPPTPPSTYPGDPDLSGVWAQGFNP